MLLGGCGAGLITGIAASDGGGGSGEVTAPELSVAPVLPLVPPAGESRSVVVTNAQLAGAARLEVRLEALSVVVPQREPSASAQGSSTLITFVLDTAPIVAAVGDPTQADVPGALSVWVDGRQVAAPVPVELARQPRESLVLPPGESQRLLSPLGERVAIRVDGLRSTTPGELQVLVTTPDPDVVAIGGEPATITRLATEIAFEPPNGSAPVVSAFVPGSTFPVGAEIVVRDFVAGQSTTVDNAYYRPDVVLALPSQGPTTGGTLVTLIGTALVPHDFTAGTAPAPFDFDAVRLSFSKGGRVTNLAPVDFRVGESDSDRLVFTMPPSPDGRPDQVDIVLRVDLGAATATVTASRVFLFANPDPFFGPRGAVLDQAPVAVSPIKLDNAPSTTEAPDFAVLTDRGGVGFLQLLLAQQNGMFQPFAAARQIGDHEVAAERGPRDLCVGDFDGDAIPDLFIVNEGATTALHHVVLGQERPLPPLGVVHRIAASPGSYRARVADFDGDQLPDVLLVPGPNAPAGLRPHVLLARPLGPGQPAFAPPVVVPVRDLPYEAFEVADLDGDGPLDVAVVSGTELRLDVAYGNGDGTFAPAVPLDFSIAGYTPDPESAAVGLHACRDGARQSLGLVLAGLLSSFGNGPTKPTITLLRQNAPRVYDPPVQPPVGPDPSTTPPVEPIGMSMASNLDAAGPIELVVAMRDDPQLISLGMLQLGPDRFEPVGSSIEGGVLTSAEAPLQIRALAFDTAFPATQPSGEAKAVFIVHEVVVDGVREKRLSTRLVATAQPGQPLLLPPDAGGEVGFGIERVVAGDFGEISVAGSGAVRDLALTRAPGMGNDEEIVLVVNDGFGGFPEIGSRMAYGGLLPSSVTLVPAPAGVVDGLAFCARDTSLGFWQNDPAGPAVQTPDAVTTPLRAVLPSPWNALDVDGGTTAQVADVDGDGVDDLVVLLSFAVAAPGPGDSYLALLRGRPAAPPGEFPFVLPTTLTPVHGNASSFAIGDFVSASGTPVLELAVAIPVGTTPNALDGNHVRFFRYAPGATAADDRFVPSAAAGGPQALLAGSGPTRLAAADLDRDGSVDLLVACRGDSTLRLFRNTGAAGAGGEVAVDAFVEGLSSPELLAVGEPTLLQLADVNGDGNLDAVAFVEFTSAVTGLRSTSIGTYLSSGAGDFDGPRFASATRTGDRDARLFGDLGDWNRDRVPDLLLGWSAIGNQNLRVLFGGTR